MRLGWALGLALAWVLGWFTFTYPVEAHTGEGFHPEALWALLRTGLFVALVVTGWIGALWLYGRAQSRRKR